MRSIYLVSHATPPTSGDLAAAAAAGASEIICGAIPGPLEALGVTTYGFHQVTEPTPVPQSVQMRQARLALLGTPWPTEAAPNQTLLDAVTAYMATAPAATQIQWNYASNVDRTDALLVAIGTALGLTSTQIDGLFVEAAAIP